MKVTSPKVKIEIIVNKDGKILLGKRKNTHNEGLWSFPGGYLEFSESWEDCALRKITEETGITVKNIHFSKITNDVFQTKKTHHITIFMLADYDSGEVKVMEPEKYEQWGWLEWDKLPQTISIPIQNLQKMNYNPPKKHQVEIRCTACKYKGVPVKWCPRIIIGILLFLFVRAIPTIIYFVFSNPYYCPKCRKRDKLIKIVDGKEKNIKAFPQWVFILNSGLVSISLLILLMSRAL